ncbi:MULTISPECIES: DUF423 domain-containing protein [Mammaliicoccus]|uniref:DUF423 domain-containing protein n=1 Tax=Mammaliicoccus vitulinus TaxID=71237 RepID=A0A2T4PS95_9STAP|nr:MULTISPECIES: DUF423 domain-containing protein [Mammaliicoccus]HAL09130.1 DUF423 domain-containing protein [Staphylococcus sp.]MBM6629764.1 DUF423 domain-containing protein [Mammaliicoccus vitulinus]MBO3075898.1 DUF423 domain-containing protein [Mammaliicoccus vitulinus]MEB7658573.1 DUF423 domain-containing protein [Mammaliicoccus vitulinus]PNZ39676.1 DUF423 domain-containing protein [Mammaliicoccus vitulinus]
MKLFIIIGAINAMIAVAAGAFGAHGLENKLSAKYLDIWEKATTYQMYHALGLILIGIITGTTSASLNVAGWLMTFGIVFFSGSLYILAVTQIKILGAITPIGGVLFIASWILLVIAVWKV